MPCPASIQRYEEHKELVDNLALMPGDVCFFTEAATHGTLPWSGALHSLPSCAIRVLLISNSEMHVTL
jgi:hypothetical protein